MDSMTEQTAERPGDGARFFDSRQKYLLFVTTCNEKRVIARRVAAELDRLRPAPPALRIFDAGVGNGAVLTRVLRACHARHPHVPLYAVGKEISIEDVRLALDRMPDRFHEHPATVLVLTNMPYADAPWLSPRSAEAAERLVWHELALSGSCAHTFDEEITALEPLLTEHWRTRTSPKTGNPLPERPAVLVIYRRDHAFLLDSILPRREAPRADFDLVIASQPYRLRVPAETKAARVLAPLSRALRPGGRLLAIHARGGDPGQEIVERVWPGENPFVHDRHVMLQATREALGAEADAFGFEAGTDQEALFRYAMHSLPSETAGPLGTSTLFAAWNAAVYVAQIDEARASAAVADGRYAEATRAVLRERGGLWFNDEAFAIARRG